MDPTGGYKVVFFNGMDRDINGMDRDTEACVFYYEQSVKHGTVITDNSRYKRPTGRVTIFKFLYFLNNATDFHAVFAEW